MPEYWGLASIAKRLNVCETTVLNWRARNGFLMYRRRRGPRAYFYTTDELIRAWQVSMCATQLREDQKRKAAQRRTR